MNIFGLWEKSSEFSRFFFFFDTGNRFRILCLRGRCCAAEWYARPSVISLIFLKLKFLFHDFCHLNIKLNKQQTMWNYEGWKWKIFDPFTKKTGHTKISIYIKKLCWSKYSKISIGPNFGWQCKLSLLSLTHHFTFMNVC